jgi:hypothetical protein
MAFRTCAIRHGQDRDGLVARPLHVLALQNGRHSDMLGAMDCAGYQGPVPDTQLTYFIDGSGLVMVLQLT